MFQKVSFLTSDVLCLAIFMIHVLYQIVNMSDIFSSFSLFSIKKDKILIQFYCAFVNNYYIISTRRKFILGYFFPLISSASGGYKSGA